VNLHHSLNLYMCVITIDLLKASKMQLHLTAPRYCIFLYSSLVAYHHRNTEIVYPRRDFGRKRERERRDRERERERSPNTRPKREKENRSRIRRMERETMENTSGSYELQRKTVDYVCLTPRLPSFFDLSLLPFATVRASPSPKRASESPRVMFEHEK